MGALDHVRERARSDAVEAQRRCRALGLAPSEVALVVERLARAPITINFHPDRRDRFGRTVAAGLLADGRYRSQFDTGISNGGRSAVEGGQRPGWEHALFGIDPTDIGDAALRPLYGALDVTHDPHGASPRFGSCHLVLAESCRSRTTLTVGDSHLGPRDVGTFDELAGVVAGWCEWIDRDGFGRALDLDAVLERDRPLVSASRPARNLDDYVEAQVHGGVDLATDVVAVVADPSFVGTAVGTALATIADRYGIALSFHDGSELAAADTPTDFRGADMPVLATTAARPDGIVDAAAIGRVLDAEPFTPPSLDGDPEDHLRQRCKRLWHCVLRYGVAAGSGRVTTTGADG